MRRRRVALALLLGLVSTVAVDALLERVLLADDLLFGRRIAPFDPPLFAPAQRAALERVSKRVAGGVDEGLGHDAELGWCPRPQTEVGPAVYDWAGARIGIAPLERQKRRPRVVAVGCSMTHGDEVKGEDTWLARFQAARPELEAANLGVSAYGLGQALLRLRRDGLPLLPDEIWLGLMPGAALRTTTHFRPLLRHWSSSVAFKPRYLLENGALRLAPNPAPRLADTLRLLEDQELLLQRLAADDWIRRAPLAYAPRDTSLLHSSFAGRLGLTWHEGLGRSSAEALSGPGERCFELIVALAREAAFMADAAGARLRFLILPVEGDLRGPRYWAELCEALRRSGVEVWDAAEVLRPHVDDGDLFMPEGHYAPAAGRLLGEALAGVWDAGGRD